MAQFTSKKEFEDAYSTLFSTFKSGRTKDLRWRKWQLKQVWWMITENEAAIISALKQDLNRHAFETHASDLLGIKGDVIEHLANVEKWSADEIPDAGFIFGTLGKARIRKEPLGVALIIGAWNFPFLLLLQPMIAAIAAGCCMVLKPSELAEATQALLTSLVPRYLDQSAIRLITGGVAETSWILEHRFNHIFFTGSTKVAKFVTAAAAKHLTPVVLELGGQCPAIVTASANIDLAAKRIAYGKFLNAGQLCLSVNHVFADPDVYDEFIERLKYWFDKFMSGSSAGYCKIVNKRNFDRLMDLLDKTQGTIACGGNSDANTCFIPPTVIKDVSRQDSLLSEELFGPFLPVIKATYMEACKTISSMEHPLAIYLFSEKKEEVDEILSNTISGGATVNDVVMHAGVPNAPFGGVGDSGYGAFHGEYGFLSFTHRRTVVAPPTWLDHVMGFRYPPWNLSNVGKVSVSQRQAFKVGERLEDQALDGTGLIHFGNRLVKTLTKVAVCVALVRLAFQFRQVLDESKGLWRLVSRSIRSKLLPS